jgi:hypothetical protein
MKGANEGAAKEESGGSGDDNVAISEELKPLNSHPSCGLYLMPVFKGCLGLQGFQLTGRSRGLV